ncbi:MAG: Gfo/Idh/MocA family oxidoreductase [Verrucomicrobiaceae bacterium]|nr:Gfo/Idh/MocA family oxidoreductase [Verrucomicrobiaceae bacterium]
MKRRSFLSKTAAATFGFQIVPSHVIRAKDGKPTPNSKIRVAAIGCGGQGGADLGGMTDEAIVGLCDVDKKRAEGSFKKFTNAKRFTDYKEMFAKMGDSIDAVLVATPDHTHSVAALEAIKHGKHVYCEKPLAHTVAEVRAMRKAAKEKKVITQVGNQGHSSNHIRLFCEMVWEGMIGAITEVHAGCDAFKQVYCQIDKASEFQRKHEVPENLDWNRWLGPLQDRPYHPNYLPFNWRGYSAFGSGCIGDWVCHVLDPTFWALGLAMPTAITAETKGYDPKIHSEFYPAGVKITFEFAATEKNGPMKIIWHDGKHGIPRPEVFEGTDRKVVGTGAVVHGTEGAIMHGSHGAGGCRLIPEKRMKDFKRPEEKITRVPGGQHQKDWLSAIREGKEAGSNFEYGGALSEIGLLGMIAIQRSGKRLEWDADAMKFTNDALANTMVAPHFREGFSLTS